jgi:hypothetical protein
MNITVSPQSMNRRLILFEKADTIGREDSIIPRSAKTGFKPVYRIFPFLRKSLDFEINQVIDICFQQI